MSAVARQRTAEVRVTDHALERHLERAGPITAKALAREVRRRLMPALKVGVRPDPQLGVHIEIQEGLVAVAAPSWEGGWHVETVYTTDEWEEWVG